MTLIKRYHHSDEHILTIKATKGGYQLTRTIKGEIVRDTMLKVGETYVVDPFNPLKKKHRGRICTIEAFIWDEQSYPNKLKIRFSDNQRVGHVELEDLIALSD